MASRHRVGLKLDLRLILFSGKEKGDVGDLVLCSYIANFVPTGQKNWESLGTRLATIVQLEKSEGR